MAALSSLSGTVQTTFRWTAQISLTGSVYNPVQASSTISKSLTLGTTVGNTTSGGADQCFSFQQAISAGSSATIDLTAMTDVMARTSQSIARIKAIQIRLLSASDDSTISPAPTATSTCSITNFGLAAPCQLDFGSKGTGLTIDVTDTAGAITGVAIGAAGTGYIKSATFPVLIAAAAGTGGVIDVTTNGSGVPTSVAIAAAGAGYTGVAGMATVHMGLYSIYTGGVRFYADPSANGFATVSSTQKNFSIRNNDGSNAITVEIDIFGGTT